MACVAFGVAPGQQCEIAECCAPMPRTGAPLLEGSGESTKSGPSRDMKEQLPWFQRMACRVLRAGPVPRHIAFIMDGNRRFARKRSVGRIVGHRRGYQTLLDVLRWCDQIGVRTVTVFAFALDNFRRSQAEVDALMDLAAEKFTEMLGHEAMMSRYGVRVRVLGVLEELPPRLRRTIAQVVQSTRGHTKLTLNIAFAYSAKREAQDAAREVAAAMASGMLHAGDADQALLQRAMYTGIDPLPDLLVRTSGETRLSDFLTWQCRGATTLKFVNTLWPEFTFWTFWAAVLEFQLGHSARTREQHELAALECAEDSREARGGVDSEDGGGGDEISEAQKGETVKCETVKRETVKRAERIDVFFAHLERKREAVIDRLAVTPVGTSS